MNERFRLAYIGIRGNADAWRSFACEVYGLQGVAGGEHLRLRVDQKAWRIQIEDSSDHGCNFVGYEVDSPREFETVLERVAAAGVAVHEDPRLSKQRGVLRLARFTAAGGMPFELVAGLQEAAQNFLSPTGARFVTGDSGLGHILITVSELAPAVDFYIKVLGLRLTDLVTVQHANVDVAFLHSPGNPRHHILAIAELPGEGRLDHLQLEVADIPTLGRAWDKVMASGIPVRNSLGQHLNDELLSFYVRSPSEFAFEYAYGGKAVDESWVVGKWETETGFLWGGRMDPENWRPVQWHRG